MIPSKENTLYLIIKQNYFDDILMGSQKQESREINYTSYNKYLDTWENDGEVYLYVDKKKLQINNHQQSSNNPMIYNNGDYPFIPIKYQFLNLVAGYNENRDSMIIAVENIHFETIKGKDGKDARFSNDTERMKIDKNGELCIWQVVYTLGEIVETDLKRDRAQGTITECINIAKTKKL